MTVLFLLDCAVYRLLHPLNLLLHTHIVTVIITSQCKGSGQEQNLKLASYQSLTRFCSELNVNFECLSFNFSLLKIINSGFCSILKFVFTEYVKMKICIFKMLLLQIQTLLYIIIYIFIKDRMKSPLLLKAQRSIKKDFLLSGFSLTTEPSPHPPKSVNEHVYQRIDQNQYAQQRPKLKRQRRTNSKRYILWFKVNHTIVQRVAFSFN